MRPLRNWSLIVSAAVLSACGGGKPEAKSPARTDGAEESGPSRPSIRATAEIGALDEDAVTQTFRDALGDLQECLHAGADRVEFVGGEIAFFVKIGKDGRLVHAHAERSTLGDRQTEKCMLDALGRRSWPAPVGGDTGLAHNSFDFDPPSDVRPPTPWDRDSIAEALEKLTAEIAECKAGVSGSFTATMYVDTEGKALAVGIAPPNEDGESASDCLASVLMDADYPSPGSWPAKVTFNL